MDGEALRTGATVVAAIGTLSAVTYALYRDLILANKRRPRLDLRFSAAGADQVIVPTVGAGAATYVRLRVTNEKGKDTADDVQVRVTAIEREGESAQLTPIGLPLTWSGSLPLATDAPVHPGVERHIDLLHVDEPVAKDELGVVDKFFEETPVQLDVHPKPAGNQHLLGEGRYEIRVDVVARNADAARYSVAVEWDGKWPGEEKMWQSLRVQPPREVQ